MTAWSIPALLVFGVAVGPYGLNLLSPSLVQLLDPGVAMALAMLGVFVGLSIDATRLKNIGVLIAVIVGGFALFVYWITPGIRAWPLSILYGMGLTGISIMVAYATWLLVGQTSFEAEQHVFVVGSLLLLGGAATYLSLSAVLAGLLGGLVWNVAGSLAKARVVRDLYYLQHPLVLLVLIIAGVAMRPTIEMLGFAIIFIVVRMALRPVGRRIARRIGEQVPEGETGARVVPPGLLAIALALDVYRVGGGSGVTTMLLGAVVAGTVVSEAIALFEPRGEALP